MKKIIILAMAMLALLNTEIKAQTDGPAYRRNYDEADGSVLERMRAGVGSASDGVYDYMTGTFRNSAKDDEDVVRVKGAYYMPLYDVNLYNGTETSEFRNSCRQMFVQRFPLANIMSIALPQLSWIHESVERNGMTIGHMQTMYCYVIAKDGEEGYINARFSFKMYKDVGNNYSPLTANWPRWERTDFLTVPLYAKLLTK